ncbi:hypothetical protein BU16DRAFT_620199 [Lophium mytilinum]|uniref:DUF6590 domain-containing protein n=1 Tax=Lophium mytilinum TaxID=390894 RepID=A0A6A6QPQ3_9PEZI|nr:hypothetical protein BU16DRAFT_620199 [Lophium mytilinum]
MASNSNPWVWSEEYRRYYCISYDEESNPVYIWQDVTPSVAPTPTSLGIASNTATATQRPPPQTWAYGSHPTSHAAVNTTTNAVYSTPTEGANDPRRRDSVMTKKAPDLGNHIKGTNGDFEELDSSYSVRKDGKRFFKRGTLFSVLFSEGMGETQKMQDNENVTTVKYGGKVFTQIRRFVVVAEREGFCYACPVFTYTGRGTLKPGCRPWEHAVIYYSTLQSPITLDGENQMKNSPIGVKPEPTETRPLSTASRVQFGKVYPIDHNVKVKLLGKVITEHMGRLIAYYKNELD